MSEKQEATYHGADVVTRLRLYGPESDYEGVMSEAAETIEGLRGRIISTPEELDALPVDAVILAEGSIAYQYYGDGAWSADFRHWDSSQIKLPATLLWVPDE